MTTPGPLVAEDAVEVQICPDTLPCRYLQGAEAGAFARRLDTPDPAEAGSGCPDAATAAAQYVARITLYGSGVNGGTGVEDVVVPLSCGAAQRTDAAGGGRTALPPAGLRAELSEGLAPPVDSLDAALDPLPQGSGRRWYGPAGPLPFDDLNLTAGPEHCNEDDIAFLNGRLLSGADQGGGRVVYARALPGTTRLSVLDPRLEVDLQVRAALPPAARWTGYRSDGVELWLDPADSDRFAYLVDTADRSHVERWARVAPAPVCD